MPYIEYNKYNTLPEQVEENRINIQNAVETSDIALAIAKEVKKQINEMELDTINKVYSVGSIYMSTNSTSPAELFGGTWEQIKDRFLLGSGDNYVSGANGGSASVTLTDSNLPNILAVGQNKSGVSKYISGTPWINQPYENQAWIITQKSYLNEAGNNYVYNQPHENMPPYLAVYIWKRIS